MNNYINRPLSLYALLLCLLFLGVGGLYGGVAFLLDPSGALLGMSTGLLERSPVHNYALPGLFLLLVMGLPPIALALVLWQRPLWFRGGALERANNEYWAWTVTFVFGVLLLGWLGYQALLLSFDAPIQWIILLVGVAVVALTLLPPVRRYYELA